MAPVLLLLLAASPHLPPASVAFSSAAAAVSAAFSATSSSAVPVPVPAGEEPDWKQYQRELSIGRDPDKRIETIQNVAYYDDVKATDFLLEHLTRTLQHLEELEEKRAKNDELLQKAIASQIGSGAADSGSINLAGLEQYQELQRRLGDQITAEERVVRGFRDALATLKDPESRELLLRTARKSKKPERLRFLLIDVFGRIDDGILTEELVEMLDDKDLAVRIAVAEALSHHSRERVPVPAYGALLNAEEWQARAVAIDALGRLGGAEAIELLVHRTFFEKGRQLTEIIERLEIMTGQKFGKTPRAWQDWWDQSKASFTQGPIVLTRPVTRKGDGRVEYWGIRVDSLRVIFVLDISGSMAAALDDLDELHPPPGEARLDLARRQVKAAIQSLPSDATFNMIAYSEVVIPWQEKMQPVSPASRKDAFEWLDKLAAVGATNIFDALEKAFSLSTASTRDRHYDRAGDTILFLSDGGPTAGRTTDCDEILAQVKEWNRVKKLTIHCFGIGKQLNRSFMTALAEQNGGQCRFID